MTKAQGRPKIELDWNLINGVLQFGARLLDCSELCKVSDDVIQSRIKEEFGITFTEYRNRKMSSMRMKLLQKQFDVAMQGNIAMLIFLGKNHLGQADKIENKNIEVTPDLPMNKEEKLQMAKIYAEKLKEEKE